MVMFINYTNLDLNTTGNSNGGEGQVRGLLLLAFQCVLPSSAMPLKFTTSLSSIATPPHIARIFREMTM